MPTRIREFDLTDAARDAAEYFIAAPSRLTCTAHGRALVSWAAILESRLASALADVKGCRDRVAALLRDLDEARAELATERAMRREGGP
jgi:hypothetical protein